MPIKLLLKVAVTKTDRLLVDAMAGLTWTTMLISLHLLKTAGELAANHSRNKATKCLTETIFN